MKLAVIGTGVSGLSAAWGLKDVADITFYDARTRPGGHSATVDIDYDGTPLAVDTGFIVYNTLNYPNLTAFFDALEIATEPSAMSFSVSTDGRRREWASASLRSVFASKRNMVSPTFIWMLREILRFNEKSRHDHANGYVGDVTLGDYLSRNRFSRRFATDYLLPMGAAIWSTPRDEVLAFPAETFISFFVNHRLVHWTQPQWRTVSGGSRIYVEKTLAAIGGTLRLGAKVIRLVRHEDGVTVVDEHGDEDRFDKVIVAAHSDQALEMLDRPTDDERRILGAIRYKPNVVYLHRDLDLMPRRKAVWSSWNYIQEAAAGPQSAVTVSYWMNRLQNLDPARPVFVTLNPVRPPRDDLTFGRYVFDHPQFDQNARDAQNCLPRIQGDGSIWYCGAYHGNGFHEDGFKAGMAVAEALGGSYAWRSPDDGSAQCFLEAAE